MAPSDTQPASPPRSTSEKKKGITYAFQDQLPKLPVPDLEATIHKYLDSLRPLQSPKEHSDSRVAVKEFLRFEGVKLQEKLKKYAEGKANYIEQFWYDSYLNFDNPVVLNLNPFFLLEDDPTPARNNQVTRAASLVVSALSFIRAVRREELQPDKVRNIPLDMYQYSRMFGTARIPTEHGCQIAQDAESKHLVVLCHGQFYWFDVLDDNSDLIMTEKDIGVNLEAIVEDASEVPVQDAAKGALGILSTENRKNWSALREILQREPGSNNSDCLNIVDSSLFILCLDYTEPTTTDDLCMNMLCGTSRIERGVQVGTCMNRWYDKLQIIVCKNGSAGINFEHTGVDGHTVLRFASDIYTDTILRFARTINGQAPSLWATNSPDPAKRDPASFGDVHTTPHKLEWTLVPELVTALRFAETRLADLIGQNEFATLEFESYGKNFITSMGMSPDAFVQMAFQAAYFGLYGQMESVYEPAMTKGFYHGRTEAIRSVTDESMTFVKTFWGDNPAEQKVDMLRKACEKHTAITRECAKGHGHDRHLYALYCMWQRGVDEEFYDYGSSAGDVASDGASNGHSNGATSPVLQPSSSQSQPSKEAEQLKQEGLNVRSARSPSSASTSSNQAHVSSNMPPLFFDSGWDKINNTVLSTSNCGNPSLRHFGFGPTSGSGFGLGYIIKDNTLSICASSKHRQTARFVSAMEAYFLEIRRLLRATRKRGASAADKTVSRARELEERPGIKGRVKSRGRNIFEAGKEREKITTPTDSIMESDEEGLGGYGFFDAGILLSALKANKESENDGKESHKRNIGRRLRLAEY
ncbi:acyltransferase ChoActase/COT/CPT [Microthyrium microscopicum]|uniref:Acyltransferase ChoActase/COT/CPT n=1 Tax=Microthyrium microscopicum TaxID=703497 RepID=A0A6A6UJG0_9PEZI|nr:acyltransferase ChoActase/COT/CPT [Microthyrium microscopicum]